MLLTFLFILFRATFESQIILIHLTGLHMDNQDIPTDIPDAPLNILDIPTDILGVILSPDLIDDLGCTMIVFTCKDLARIVRGQYPILAKKEVCSRSVGFGLDSILTWAYDMGCPLTTETFAWATNVGDTQILEWLRLKECPADANAFTRAARAPDNIETLEWLKARDYPCDSTAFSNAAACGRIDALEWLEKNDAPRILVDASHRAIIGGHFDVVLWLYARGCGFNGVSFMYAAKYNHLDIIEWLMERNCARGSEVCAHIAGHGHLELLGKMRAQGYPWDYTVYINALKNNHLNVFEWAYKNGCPVSTEVCAYFAREGNLAMLKFLRDPTTSVFPRTAFPWDANTFEAAACVGRIDIFEWLRDHGCPWDEETLDNATYHGPLESVKWLYERGCPLSEDAFFNALYKYDVELLEYLVEEGCPYDYARILREKGDLNTDAVRWVFTHLNPDRDASPPGPAVHLDIQKHMQLANNYVDEGMIACIYASSMGHLATLLLVERVHRHYDIIRDCSAEQGHLHIIRWLVDENQSVSAARIPAETRGHTHVIDWLDSIGQ